MKIETWKKVITGTLKTEAVAREQLAEAGVKITDWGDHLLKRISFEEKEDSLDLALVMVRKLGLKNHMGAGTKRMFGQADEK